MTMVPVPADTVDNVSPGQHVLTADQRVVIAMSWGDFQ